ncbi:MAG: DUF3568 family protein [Phycisphaerae bacterium]|nr:DUF3568 family protein [Phycisphaerae bacterium]
MTAARALIAPAACAAALAACATPVVVATASVSALQAGTAAYIDGQLQAAHAANLDEAFAAAQAALAELRFTITSAKLRSNSALIVATESDGHSLGVTLTRRTPGVTKVAIRVGLFGDQAVSRLILSHYQMHLPPAPHPRP